VLMLEVGEMLEKARADNNAEYSTLWLAKIYSVALTPTSMRRATSLLDGFTGMNLNSGKLTLNTQVLRDRYQ